MDSSAFGHTLDALYPRLEHPLYQNQVEAASFEFYGVAMFSLFTILDRHRQLLDHLLRDDFA